jgi:hypothetical protein
MPFGIEERDNKIISDIENNLFDIAFEIGKKVKGRKKQLEVLIAALEQLKERELYNPLFSVTAVLSNSPRSLPFILDHINL